MEDFKSRIPAEQYLAESLHRSGGDSTYITFFVSEWKKIIESLEDLNKLEKIKMLIKRYHILNKSAIRVIAINPSNKMWFSWLSHQKKALTSPIMFCIKNQDVDMMELVAANVDHKIHLSNMGRPEPPLIHLVVKTGKLELVRIVSRFTPFIDMEAVSVKDGRTALHVAAEEGHLLIFRFLQGNAKFSDPRDNLGRTPYNLATEEIKMYLDSPPSSTRALMRALL